MKKLWILLAVLVLCIMGYVIFNKTEGDVYYLGVGDSWLATYSVNKVNNSYYDSLSIQYIYDECSSEPEVVSPIEYTLVGNSSTKESSFPQELQGILNFHVASRINADFFETNFDNQMQLTVKWQGKEEHILLKKK